MKKRYDPPFSLNEPRNKKYKRTREKDFFYDSLKERKRKIRYRIRILF